MDLVTCDDIQCCILFSDRHGLLDMVRDAKRRFGVHSDADRSMKQSEPFMCKTYLGVNLLELYLRNLDCSFNASRVRLRGFIYDHVDMAASCTSKAVSCVLLYGFSKSVTLACQYVVSQVLRQRRTAEEGRCRFVICIGRENDPISNSIAACRVHLNGFCTMVRYKPSSAAAKSEWRPPPQLKKICAKLCDAVARGASHSQRQRLMIMKEIDSYITNTSTKMSTVLRQFVSDLSARQDVPDATKFAVAQNCATLDSWFPRIGNSKTVPIVLSQLLSVHSVLVEEEEPASSLGK